MRIVGTIEARMGSSRLPGKTLSEIYDGMHLLECVVRRFRLANRIADVVVATTTKSGDNQIVEWCNANRVSLFRGSEEDVLDRVVGAALQYGADAIVQMGADSAYLDYELIDQLVALYQTGNYDYVCNDLKRGYPIGVYGHVVSVEKLRELNQRHDLTQEDRGDVVRYIWEHPENYGMYNLEASRDYAFPELRLTIDYPDDLELAREVYAYFQGYRFTTAQVIAFYRQRPHLFEKTKTLVQRSAPYLSKARSN